MTTSFPGALDSFSTKVDSVDYVLASHVNNIQDSIVAIQTEILTPVNGGRPNLLYDTLTYDLWLTGTTNDFGDDQYLGGCLWNALQNGQAPTIQKVAAGSTDPFTHYLRVDFDSAASQAGIVQFLSAADSKRLRGKTVSISADLWGAAAGSTNMRMAVLEWAGTADTLTSDVVGTWATGNPTLAANWSYVGTPASIPITTTRTRCAVQNLTLSSTLNNLAVFIWTPDSEGSTEEFDVARVKLEIGSTATDFITQEFSKEFMSVQSFVETSYALGTTLGAASVLADGNNSAAFGRAATTTNLTVLGGGQFAVTKSRAPTITLWGYDGTISSVSNQLAGGHVGTAAAGLAARGSIPSLTDAGAPYTIGNFYWFGWLADARL